MGVILKKKKKKLRDFGNLTKPSLLAIHSPIHQPLLLTLLHILQDPHSSLNYHQLKQKS